MSDEPVGPLDLVRKHPDIPVHVALRSMAVLAYDMVQATRPVAADRWTPFRDRMQRSSKCYRMASGAMVHVKPECRCPR